MTAQREVLPQEVELRAVILDGTSHNDGRVTVRFDPRGNVSDHSIILAQGVEGVYENQYTVEVLPLTGLIRFHDGEYIRDAVDEGDFQ